MAVGTTPARVYLVRHGETAWSLDGRHTSRTDLPLTAHGEEECRLLAEPLRTVRLSQVLCSPRLRARRTCDLVGWIRAVEVDPDLAEWDYGDYEGLRSVEIRTTRPDWDLFRDGCPGGESPAQVSDRANRIIARLRTFEGSTGICSHGHFGRVLAARWIRQSVAEARRFLLSTATISVLGYEHERTDRPAIVSWNAASAPR
jgi:broad specificity phosphatase PhoE